MKWIIKTGLALSLCLAGSALADKLYSIGNPEQDVENYRAFFQQRFPGVALDQFGDGRYAIDPVARAEWQQIMEFPPYEPSIEEGKRLFDAKFKNGKGYADCFPDGGIGIANRYPYWDREKGMVITLELAVNHCREANGEAPLPYQKGQIASVLAYMADTSRGKKISIEIPKDDPRALEAYEKGKAFYFTRRGQLNFACKHCHFDNAGHKVRSDMLSPALGQTTHWPAYRSAWGNMGTLQRRFDGCLEMIRATKFAPQSEEYRDLEYFMTYMNNGMALNGPGTRF